MRESGKHEVSFPIFGNIKKDVGFLILIGIQIQTESSHSFVLLLIIPICCMLCVTLACSKASIRLIRWAPSGNFELIT